MIQPNSARSPRRALRWAAMRWVMVTGALAFAGCSKDPSGPASDSAAVENPSPSERWYSLYLNKQKIGHQVVTVKLVEHGGESLLESRTVVVLDAVRGGAPTEHRVELGELTTYDGQLREFERKTIAPGAPPHITRGQVVGETLRISDSIAGERDAPWANGALASEGWERFLQRHPLAEGQSCSVQSLHGLTLQLASEELTSAGLEMTETPSGSRRLTRIDRKLTAPGVQPIAAQVWLAADGRCAKVATAPAMEMHLVSREVALAPEAKKVDLVYGMTIAVSPAIAAPGEAKVVKYRVAAARGAPEALFPAGPTQAVRRIDERTVEVFVRAMGDSEDLALPAAGVAFPAEASPPTPAEGRANGMLQSEDAAVVELAREAAPPEARGADLARRLERHVRQSMREVNYRSMLDTAAQVARKREGDCTEHAVLLAAMLRARGVPSRLAIGLVYLERQQAMGFHMWTEAWIGDRWLPLDALFAAGAGAERIKIASTSLDAASADPAMLKIAEALGSGLSIAATTLAPSSPK